MGTFFPLTGEIFLSWDHARVVHQNDADKLIWGDLAYMRHWICLDLRATSGSLLTFRLEPCVQTCQLDITHLCSLCNAASDLWH